MTTDQHHFLIAMPSVKDPLFARSVIYLCEFHPDGAIGLLINKPVEQLSIKSLLLKQNIPVATYAEYSPLDQPVLLGGPVDNEHGTVLHTPMPNFSASEQMSSEIMVTSSKDVLQTLGTNRQPKNFAVFLGYSSWPAGQLEKEITDNQWLMISANAQLLFAVPIEQRWQQAVNALGIDITRISQQTGHA